MFDKESKDKDDNPTKDANSRSSEVEGIRAIADSVINQNKRDLSFRKFKFILMGAFFVGVLFMQTGAEYIRDVLDLEGSYVNVVKISGAIAPGASTSPEKIIPFLEKAFKDNDAQGVIIHINSPGGTPVASSAIRDRIISLRQQYPDKKVIAVGEDYMTSGAYMVATGTDKIYANQSSVVGSIGVIIRAFDAHKLAENMGVSRRVIHAGSNKVGMDTFLPLPEDQKKHLQATLESVHQQFINMVKESRNDRLDLSKTNLFTGEYWTGEESLSLGLIDGLGHLHSISDEEFGTTVFKELAPKKSLAEALNPMASLKQDFDGFFGDLNLSNRPLLMAY